jgi:hypothetical protein
MINNKGIKPLGAKLEWYKQNQVRPYNEGVGKNGVLIVTYDKQVRLQDGSMAKAISVKEIDDVIAQVLIAKHKINDAFTALIMLNLCFPSAISLRNKLRSLYQI